MAYNVEKYIDECLTSVLSQKVNFEYLIYIGNDGSNDNTLPIIQSYKKKYPQTIELFITDRLPRKYPGDYINFRNLFLKTKTEYFCVLDGDDFWLDEYKLQKQIDFLDNNKDFTVCGHNYYLMTNGKMIPAHNIKEDHKYKFTCDTFDEVLLGGHCPYMQTSSLVYRNIFKDNKIVQDYFKSHMYKGDFIRTLLHASMGRVKFINELMSVYRITSQGDWTRMNECEQIKLHINFFIFHKQNTFSSKYSRFFEEAIIKETEKLFKNSVGFISKIKFLKYLIYSYYYRIKMNFYSLNQSSKSNLPSTRLLDINFLNESYSQHGEDNILVNVLNYKKNGFFIDIGSHHPFRFSNTYKLYKMGWSGINIDPMPNSKRMFDLARPRDINLEIGISKERGYLKYYIFEESALNTFSPSMVKEAFENYKVKPIESKEIEVTTLEKCLDKHLAPNTKIDLMNIDVEGLDYEVLLSNNWQKYKPEIIVCEIKNSDILTILDQESYKFLCGLGYTLISKTVLSCIFILNK